MWRSISLSKNPRKRINEMISIFSNQLTVISPWCRLRLIRTTSLRLLRIRAWVWGKEGIMGSKKLLMILLAGAFLAAGLTAVADSPFLPGITVADEHPQGCIDCHKDLGGGRDHRLNVSLKADGHVDITAIVKTVPNDCGMCHREGVAAGPLNQRAHQVHYQDPDDNVFVKNYQGACLNCHKLDVASGTMTMKSGPKNW